MKISLPASKRDFQPFYSFLGDSAVSVPAMKAVVFI
jgi:hypothetical protein